MKLLLLHFMTRFGIKLSEKIQLFSILTYNLYLFFQMQTVNIINVYHKKRQAFRFQSGDVQLVDTKEIWSDRIHFFLSENKEIFALKILLAPPNAPVDVDIGCIAPSCKHILLSNTWFTCLCAKQTTQSIGIFV